jgi:hypothetical protein
MKWSEPKPARQVASAMLFQARVKLKRPTPRSHRPDPDHLRKAWWAPPRGLDARRSPFGEASEASHPRPALPWDGAGTLSRQPPFVVSDSP